MSITVRLKFCYIWDVLFVHDGAFGLDFFWSIDACYELSLCSKLWTWLKVVETWKLFTAEIGN
jgi:hypothetical protein